MIQEKPLGELLKELLKRKGLSQRKLADLSGIEREYINQLVNGKTNSITSSIP